MKPLWLDVLLLIDLNPVEPEYYPFMVSLDKCSGSVIPVMTHLWKYVFQVKEKT